MTSKKLTDSELIEFVYCELAGQIIRENVPDFSNIKNWRKVVSEMTIPIATTYRLGILNSQVMNGGLIQYFDNGYGIFALETLEDLQRVGANLTHKVLSDCLEIINPKNYTGERFVNFIRYREYQIDELNYQDNLDKLDEQYYSLSEIEDLEILVALYLRQNEVSNNSA